MNEAISVSPAALRVAGAVEALASLPVSFRVGGTHHPRVDAVQGAGWMRDALEGILRGSDGILAVPSGAADPVAEAAIQKSGRPVVLDDRWSHNPGLGPLTAAIAQVPDAALVELRAHVTEEDDPVEAFTDLLVVAEIVAGPLTTIRLASVREHVVTATGAAARAAELLITVHRSAAGAGTARVRAVGTTRAADAAIPGSSSAAAATVRLHGPEGVMHYPTIFESGHRAAWRALAAALREGTAAAEMARRSRLRALIDPQLSAQEHSDPTVSSTPAVGAATAPAENEERK